MIRRANKTEIAGTREQIVDEAISRVSVPFTRRLRIHEAGSAIKKITEALKKAPNLTVVSEAKSTQITRGKGLDEETFIFEPHPTHAERVIVRRTKAGRTAVWNIFTDKVDEFQRALSSGLPVRLATKKDSTEGKVVVIRRPQPMAPVAPGSKTLAA